MSDTDRDLIAGQKATQLALKVYHCTREFPRDELYGLTSQMRRAAISVASNIAEGKGRYSRKEFAQFLCRARGSRLEMETQLFIAEGLNYIQSPAAGEITAKSQELGRILNGLTKSIVDGSNVTA